MLLLSLSHVMFSYYHNSIHVLNTRRLSQIGDRLLAPNSRMKFLRIPSTFCERITRSQRTMARKKNLNSSRSRKFPAKTIINRIAIEVQDSRQTILGLRATGIRMKHPKLAMVVHQHLVQRIINIVHVHLITTHHRNQLNKTVRPVHRLRHRKSR